MDNGQKREKLQSLLAQKHGYEWEYNECLREIGDQKQNYHDFLETEPVDATKELKRLPDADYNLCAALLTMLLSEDHWINGSFEQRCRNGEVTPILQRMIDLL